MKNILHFYENSTIGVNFDSPETIDAARLLQVNEDHFSIFAPQKGLRFSYPLSSIISISEKMENEEAEASGPESDDDDYPVVIQVIHPTG